MLARRVLEHGGHWEQCGYFVESNEYSASANRTVADKPTFSDEYRKLKEMLVDSSTILVSGRRHSGGTATGVANRHTTADSTTWPICRSRQKEYWYCALTPTTRLPQRLEIWRFHVSALRAYGKGHNLIDISQTLIGLSLIKTL